MTLPLDVLFEDNHLLVLNKPALLPTMGAAAGEVSLVDQAKAYLKRKYAKPGNVYLGVVSRLDAHVSGVIVLARTSKAAARLTRQFQTREVDKLYWAVVARCLEPVAGSLRDWIRKDDAARHMTVTAPGAAGSKEALLDYRVLQAVRGGHLVEIELLTGRKHQIRVQLAHRGCPILGDRKYGGPHGFSPGIALHSRRVAFRHPVGQAALEFTAPLPASWRQFGLQGDLS